MLNVFHILFILPLLSIFSDVFFFHAPLCWRALVLSLISAHYRISLRLILNVAVIIKRAAVEVQLVLVAGL